MKSVEWLQLLVLKSFEKLGDEDGNTLVNIPTNASLKDRKWVQLQSKKRIPLGHHTTVKCGNTEGA